MYDLPEPKRSELAGLAERHALPGWLDATEGLQANDQGNNIATNTKDRGVGVPARGRAKLDKMYGERTITSKGESLPVSCQALLPKGPEGR